MRRRIAEAAQTRIGGNNSPALLDGQKTKNKKLNILINACAKDAYLQFFKGTALDQGYCDAQFRLDEITVGIEPAYIYEELKIITINKLKGYSHFSTGQALGAWGSQLRTHSKMYNDYKRDCKFVRFVDKWHPKLYKTKKL